MIKTDSHTHPFQQRRCYEELELFAETALAKGLEGIVFTEHAPMIFDLGHHFLTEKELELYLELGEKCKETYKGRLNITVGVEADYFPDNMDYLCKLIEKYHLTYLSASIHFHLPYWQETIGVISDEKRTELALRKTLEAIRTGVYHTLNHLDFFRIKQDTYEPGPLKDIYLEIFEEMVKRDVALEWNSNGFKRGYDCGMPCDEVWKWSLEYPLRRTFGSDAHLAENVAQYFGKYEERFSLNP